MTEGLKIPNDAIVEKSLPENSQKLSDGKHGQHGVLLVNGSSTKFNQTLPL